MLLIGRSTRLSRYVTGLDKTYTATARLGAVSDTLDAEGDITILDTPLPSENAIRDALPVFTGDILQVPPMASALKREGTRLYDLHRKGITVERKPRPVKVYDFRLTSRRPGRRDGHLRDLLQQRNLRKDPHRRPRRTRSAQAPTSPPCSRKSVGHLTVKDALSAPEPHPRNPT